MWSRQARSFASGLVARVAAFALPPRVMRNKRHFEIWQRRGYHVTPVNYYEPVPNTAEIPNGFWDCERPVGGIDWNESVQLSLLRSVCEKYKPEYETIPHESSEASSFFLRNGNFVSVDAEVLYSIIREFKPRRIVEVGSGFSTCLGVQAIRKNKSENANHDCCFTSIEPYPSALLRKLIAATAVRLIEAKVQAVSIDEFLSLGEGDILFIDSSHVCAPASDVDFEICSVLPQLRPGVLVHFHDIFLPMEYPKAWVMDRKVFWNEQYMVQAFLAFNSAFEVLWAGHYMHLRHPSELKVAFSSYDPATVSPASLWLRRSG